MAAKTNIKQVSSAYVSFFKKTLPDVALSPYIGAFNAINKKTNNGIAAFTGTFLLALPLAIPTIATSLLAGIAFILAALAAPFVFAGAALADLSSPRSVIL